MKAGVERSASAFFRNLGPSVTHVYTFTPHPGLKSPINLKFHTGPVLVVQFASLPPEDNATR